MTTIGSDQVAEITMQVWSSVLELDAIPRLDLPEAAGAELAGAQVRISGGWKGRVTFHCDRSMAARLTARMLTAEADEVDHEQIGDAVGELVNMVGGNLKALVPGPSQLSLPEPIDPPSGSRLAELAFDCEGGTFFVAVDSFEAPDV